MAVRKSDVEVYKSGISSVLEGAEQKTAAFNDPFIQAMQLGTQISDTYQTAMSLTPKVKDFMSGIRGEEPLGEEADAAARNALSLDTTPGMLGPVDYTLDRPDVSITGLKKTDFSLETPGFKSAAIEMNDAREKTMSEFEDSKDKFKYDVLRNFNPQLIDSFANSINDIEKLTPYKKDNLTYVTEDGTKTGVGYLADFYNVFTTPGPGKFGFNYKEGDE